MTFENKLLETPPFRCNPDGIVRIWAYIGSDNSVRGATHGATALAELVAEKLGVKSLYVDHAMLEKSFPQTRSVAEQLQLLIAREGYPDILFGQTSESVLTKTNAMPTFQIDTIMTTMATNLFRDGKMAEIVPHHVTPQVLHGAGEKFLKRHPVLKHPLTAIFVNTKDPTEEDIRMLNESCSATEGTFYFCPTPHRTGAHYYETLVNAFTDSCAGTGRDVIAAQIHDVQIFYNPYLGLLDQADNVIVIGESRSVVSEALMKGRPVHIDWHPVKTADPLERHYESLLQEGYVKYLYDQEPGKPLDSAMLAPLNSTEAIADHIVKEFDRGARMRTLRPDMMALQNPCGTILKP